MSTSSRFTRARHVLPALFPLLIWACGTSSPNSSSGSDGGASSGGGGGGGSSGGGSSGGGGGSSGGGAGGGGGSSVDADVDSATGPTGPSGTLSVWTAGVGTKLQPTTAPGTATSISVATARESWAAAQLVVHGSAGNVQGVTVTAADLSDGSGHTLAKSNITFFLEYFIDFAGVKAITGNQPVPANSMTADTRLPDPLIPLVDPYTQMNAGQPFFVNPDQNQPIWVDVYVPSGTVAGTYTGAITVAANGGLAASVPISVKVWNIDLPNLGTVTTHFQMSINALIDYHAGISQCEGSDCYLSDSAQAHTIVKRYEELAHEHRIDTGQKFGGGAGSGCTVPTDWTSYDAAMTPYMTGAYFADGVPSSRFDVPFSPGSGQGLEMCTQAQYIALAKAWATHLKANGWFAKAIAYAADEPEMSQFAAIAQNSSWMQMGDPDWKAHVMDTTSPTTSKAATLNPAIGIYTVNLPEYDDWDGNSFYGRSQWPALMTAGTQLWFYESNSVTPPYPTFATNTVDGLEPVMAMWGSWYESATGFLYWDIADWTTKDPWGPNIGFGMTGDGTLLYPGNHAGTMAPIGSPTNVAIDGPIPSYRLKMVRQGLQDWALFRLADTKGLTSTVRTQIAKVYGQLGGCTYQGCPPAQNGSFFWKDDEVAMDAIRAAVAAAIAP